MLSFKEKIDNNKVLRLYFLYVTNRAIELCQKHILIDLLTNFYVRDLFKENLMQWDFARDPQFNQSLFLLIYVIWKRKTTRCSLTIKKKKKLWLKDY